MCAYQALDELLRLVDAPSGPAMQRLFDDHRERFSHARGSSRNHQAWPGGFWDHMTEVLNLAVALYRSLGERRPLPFTLSDALLVLAAHDLEKMVRFDEHGLPDPALDAKRDKAAFRLALLERYDIMLTPAQANAMLFAEGVRDQDYTNSCRMMGPLAAFVHSCDLLSARMWFNHPLARDDPWDGARRAHPHARDVDIAEEPLRADGWPRAAPQRLTEAEQPDTSI